MTPPAPPDIEALERAYDAAEADARARQARSRRDGALIEGECLLTIATRLVDLAQEEESLQVPGVERQHTLEPGRRFVRTPPRDPCGGREPTTR